MHPWQWERPDDEAEMLRVSMMDSRAVIVLSGMGSKVDCDSETMRSVMTLAGLQSGEDTLQSRGVKVGVSRLARA